MKLSSRRATFLSFAAAAVAAVLVSGTAPATAAPTDAAIRGVLVDQHGHPLQGVVVTAVEAQRVPGGEGSALTYGRPATTDATGLFVIRGIDTTGADPAGLELNLDADPSAATGGDSPTGYAQQCLGGAAYCDEPTPSGQHRLTVTVTAGHTTSAPRTALVEAAVLTGQLVESGTGRAVSGYPVAVYSNRTSADGHELPDTATTSDAAGAWTLRGLFPQPATPCFGDWTIAGAPNTVDGYLGQCWQGRPLLLGHTGDRIALAAGTVTRIRTVLVPNGGVTGLVTDRAGTPVAGATVFVGNPNNAGGDPAAVRRAVTGADGTYRVAGVEPGRQGLCASADATGCATPMRAIGVRAGQTVTAPTLVVRRST